MVMTNSISQPKSVIGRSMASAAALSVPLLLLLLLLIFLDLNGGSPRTTTMVSGQRRVPPKKLLSDGSGRILVGHSKKFLSSQDRALKAALQAKQSLKDSKHGIKMGLSDPNCDDAQTNNERDWDGAYANYTCVTHKTPIPIASHVDPLEECEVIPPDYYPQHHCMDTRIEYNTSSSSLPTYGDHRPLWPVFGEYLFVPPQRWLHNIEHGSIVMLYHPCAHPAMVNRLRALVVGCIRKHIITPSNQVSVERPLVLIAWGCRLEMNRVDSERVVHFIKRNALKGPEGKYTKQGQYTKLLLRPAEPVLGSDYKDSRLCPFAR